MAVSLSSEPRSDITGFQFKLLTRLKVFDSQKELFTSSTNLLASASKYGLVFVGCPSGFQVIVLSAVVGCLPDNKDGSTSYHRRFISLPSQPSHLVLSCDQTHIVVAIRKSGSAHALIYNVPSFMSQNEVIVNEVRLSPSPEVLAVDLSWNPGTANMLASCMSDGSVTVYDFQPTGVNINSIPPESRSTCVSWSPKGKQIVVGSDEGALTQYKPDMKAVKTLAGPQVPGKQYSVVNVVWLSNFQFCAVYRDKSNPQDSQALMIVNAPKAGPMTFVNYDDVCYSTGQLRPPQFYFSHMQQWNLLLVGSGNSIEIGVLGLDSNQSSWVAWLFDDGARAELPLTSDTQETFLVGMAVDTSTTYKLPWGENNMESVGPMPVLLMLSHYGILCVYYMVNLLQGYPTVCSPPEQLSDLSGLNLFLPGGSGGSVVQAHSSVPTSTLASPNSQASVVQEIPDQKHANPPNLFTSPAPSPGLFASAIPQVSASSTMFQVTPTAVPVPSTVPSIFGGVPMPSSTAGVFGSNVQVPNLFGSLSSNQTSGSIFAGASAPNLFGAPAISSQSATSIFGGQVTAPTATHSLFGGAPSDQISSTAPSIFTTPATSSFSFTTQQTKPTNPLTLGTVTPPLTTNTDTGATSGFSFGAGFLSGSSASTMPSQTTMESKPTGSVFGGFSFNQPTQEQTKSLFTMPATSSHTETTQPLTSGLGNLDNTKQQVGIVNSQLKLHPSTESGVEVHAVSEQYQVPSSFASHQHQSSVSPVQTQSEEIQKLKTGSPPVYDKTTKEEVEEIANSVFITAISEEMSHLETRLQELRKRVGRVNIETIGTEDEKCFLSCNVESMNDFVTDLNDTTQGQIKEINALRTVTFESLAWLEEARSRRQQIKSPRFQQLQQTLDLDHSSTRRLANIQHLVYYVDSQLSQVMAQLDCDWLQLQDKSKDTRSNRLEPTVDAIYRTLMSQNLIVSRQRQILLDLVKRAQPISKHSQDLISNMSVSHIASRGTDTQLERLADSLVQVKLGSNKRDKLSSRKQEKLMTLLTDRPVTRIRAVRPATSSILDLPPIKSGSITSGLPVKAITPTKKVFESPSHPPKISAQVSHVTGGTTFSIPSNMNAQKGASIKQALTFSTPVTTGGHTFIGPTFGSTNKTIQSISKDLSAYYENVTPPQSPEPELKLGESEVTHSFSSFNISLSDKNIQNVLAKPVASNTYTVPKDIPKSVPKPQAETIKPATTHFPESVPEVIVSDSLTATTSSQLSSFSFINTPKTSSTSLFSGVKPSTTPTLSTTSVFGGFSAGANENWKPSIFGGSSTGGITFGKPKEPEGQSQTMSAVIPIVSTQAQPETGGKIEKSDKKSTLPISTVASQFSFATPSSTTASVFGQKSSFSTFSFAQVKDQPQLTTVASTVASTQSESIKSVAESPPKLPVSGAPAAVEQTQPSITVSSSPGVVSISSPTSSIVTQPTSTMTAFSFAKPPTETSPRPPAVTTDTVQSSVTESNKTFFGQQICSPTSFGQSGGNLFGKPITSPTTSSIFGGFSSSKTPILGATTEQPKSTVVISEPSTVSSENISVSSPVTLVIEAKSPSTSTSSIFGSSGIPTTTATNVFGVTITPVTTPSASPSPATSTSTEPVAVEIKSPAVLTATTTTTITTVASNSVAALTSLFGSTITPTTSTSVFGGQSSGSQSPFGTPSISSSATPLAPIFRANVGATSPVSSPSIFGQSTTTSPSVFGQATSPPGTVFGGAGDAPNTTASSAFGTSGRSLFGGSSSSNLFGATAATSSSSVFGQGPTQTPSLFGQAPTTTQSIFGQAASPATTSSPFSAKPSIFGQSQETSTTAFGSPTSFGQSSQSVFGQSTPGSFGSSGGSMFGGGSAMFGSSPASGGFGSSSPSSGGLFSSNTSPSISQTGFGGSSIFQNKPSGFGGSPVFGGNAAFGAAPSFGSAPAFGGAPAFGSPTKVFGAGSPTSNTECSTGFGSVSPTQQSSTFENLASQNTMSFGNLAQGQPQGFGSPQPPLFGAPQPSAAPPPSAFSSGSSSFGGSSFSSWR